MGKQLYWVLKTYTERRGTHWFDDWRLAISGFFVMSWLTIIISDRQISLVPEIGTEWPSAVRFVAGGKLHVRQEQPPTWIDRIRGIVQGVPSPVERITFDRSFAATFRDAWNEPDLFEHAPHLQGVRIEDVLDASPVISQLSQLPELEVVELIGSNLSPNDLEALASSASLRHLRLQDCRWESSLNELKNAPRLQTLIIEHGDGRVIHMPSDGAGEVNPFHDPDLPSLEVLAVDAIAVNLHDGTSRRWPTDDDLSNVRRLPNLRRLFVRDYPIGLKPVGEIQRVLPHVQVLPIYVRDKMLFMSLVLHGMAILRLFGQLSAQMSTTLCPVVPRYWRSHQIVFIGLALLIAAHQTIQLWVAGVAFEVSIAISLMYYTVWGITTIAAVDSSGKPQSTIAERLLHWLAMNITILIAAVVVALTFFQEALFDSTETRIFLLGKYPALTLGLGAAGALGMITVALLLPRQARQQYEAFDKLPPMDASSKSYREWASATKEKRRRSNGNTKMYAYLTPGCVFQNPSKRSRLVGDAKRFSTPALWMRVLGVFVFASIVWCVTTVITNDNVFSRNPAAVSLWAWLLSVGCGIASVQSWDERRSLMGIELMRPAMHSEIQRDFLLAIVRDIAVFVVAQIVVIALYAFFNQTAAYFSTPLVIILLAIWGVIPAYVMSLLTITRDEDAYPFRMLFALLMFFGQLVLITSQAFFVGGKQMSPPFQWLYAFLAVIVLCAYIEHAKRRWRDLEWDV